jgi:hypothetical protein
MFDPEETFSAEEFTERNARRLRNMDLDSGDLTAELSDEEYAELQALREEAEEDGDAWWW